MHILSKSSLLTRPRARNTNETSFAALPAMVLVPYPADRMAQSRVGKRVDSVKNETRVGCALLYRPEVAFGSWPTLRERVAKSSSVRATLLRPILAEPSTIWRECDT
jgi:hypothetical protein